MSTVPDSDAATCPNCGHPRSGSHCSNCGQKAMPIAPTLGYFLHELTHEVVHVDGKIFRSLRLLLTRPGFLTSEIFLGRRASYVSPIRLYLIASIAVFSMRAFFGVYEDNVVDPAVVERAAETELAVDTAVNVWLPRAMFVLVPLFAAIVMLHRRGRHTYPQHLYFALHFHAAWFFAEAVAQLLGGLVTLPFAADVADTTYRLYGVAYFFVAFRRVYGTTIWGTLWRTVTIGSLYFVALMLALMAIAAPLMWPYW